MKTKNSKELDAKRLEIEHLDNATQEIIRRQHKSNQKMLIFGFISLTLLLILGVFGVYKQNQIALQNKNHIDCIVKLLATPTTSGQTRHIVNLGTCQIKVSP